MTFTTTTDPDTAPYAGFREVSDPWVGDDQSHYVRLQTQTRCAVRLDLMLSQSNYAYIDWPEQVPSRIGGDFGSLADDIVVLEAGVDYLAQIDGTGTLQLRVSEQTTDFTTTQLDDHRFITGFGHYNELTMQLDYRTQGTPYQRYSPQRVQDFASAPPFWGTASVTMGGDDVPPTAEAINLAFRLARRLQDESRDEGTPAPPYNPSTLTNAPTDPFSGTVFPYTACLAAGGRHDRVHYNGDGTDHYRVNAEFRGVAIGVNLTTLATGTGTSGPDGEYPQPEGTTLVSFPTYSMVKLELAVDESVQDYGEDGKENVVGRWVYGPTPAGDATVSETSPWGWDRTGLPFGPKESNQHPSTYTATLRPLADAVAGTPSPWVEVSDWEAMMSREQTQSGFGGYGGMVIVGLPDTLVDNDVTPTFVPPVDTALLESGETQYFGGERRQFPAFRITTRPTPYEYVSTPELFEPDVEPEVPEVATARLGQVRRRFVG